MSEQSNNIDVMTHPSAYRDAVNSKVNEKINQEFESQPENQANSQDWDLYPQLMRQIENEGSDKQVEELHRIQKTLSH